MNKDDDPTNDCVAYSTTGWWDEQYIEYYESHTWENSNSGASVQDVADAAGWDGIGPIKVYSDLSLRMIKVMYDCGGYEDDYFFDTVGYYSWYDAPYSRGLVWPGHRFLGVTDGLGHEIEGDMTCGEILSELIGDKWADTLYIYYVWEEIHYTVHFINQYNGEYSYSIGYTDVIDLPTGDPAFPQPDYEFVGWFTEPDGAGQQVTAGTRYSAVVRSDQVDTLTLYAYFRPVEIAS